MRKLGPVSPLPDPKPSNEYSGTTLFESETLRAMRAVGKSLADLVARVPGENARATDLQRALNLDSKLCWQVFNIIRAEDPLTSAHHVPGAPSLNRLLAAAENVGVPSLVIDRVREAVDQFNSVVQAHAPDRASFDSMVSAATAGESGSATDLFHRRNAYRSESHIWGVQVDTYIAASILHPPGSGEGKDELSLSVRLGQRRLRADAPIIVHRFSTHASFKLLPADIRQPLDREAAEKYHAPLLPDFCSKPLPELKTVIQDDGPGRTQIELAGGAVGRQASVNLVFGGLSRNVPFSIDADGKRVSRESVRFITPTELHIHDLFVHRPTYGEVWPSLVVFPRTDGTEPPQVLKGTQRLPMHETITRLGTGIQNISIPEYDRYPELVRHACRSVNWNPAEFDVFRVRIPYPILNSIVRLEFAYND